MSDALLSLSNITQVFGGLVAVDDVSVEIRKGEIVGIIGPNGAGKTTLFNVVTGQYNPTAGSVLFAGQDITRHKPHEIIEKGLARTFQNIRLFSNMTVLENVMVGAHCRHKITLLDAMLRNKRQREAERGMLEKAYEVLRFVGLIEYRHDLAGSLPYGHQRRLEIARAMASDPQLLLFDEPAAGMNEQETDDLTRLVHELREEGYTILLIEHDMHFVMNICERIYVLNYGQMIAHGSPQDIQTSPVVIEAYLGKEVRA